MSEYDRGFIRGIGSYFAQIWHSTSHDQVPFYPLWFNQFLNRKLPVILDTNNLMLVYSSVPVLRTILDTKGQMLSQARIRLFEVNPDGSDGKEVFKHPVLDLLKRPNCVNQNGNEFMKQWMLMYDLYQTCLIYKNKAGRTSFPRSLFVMPTGEFKINPTGYIFDQLKVEDVIENYEHINAQYPAAQPRYYKPFEIMRYVDGPTDRYFFGIPKIITNKLVASNLQSALQTRNILLNDMGAHGILSSESNKDSMGAIPLDDDERHRLEKAYSHEYGIGEGQSKVIITPSSLKWQPITYPVKDLLAFEEVESCQVHLCDMYGIQRGILGDSTASKTKDSIGGDGKGKIEEAMKITLETTIQAAVDVFLEGFNLDPDYGLIDINGNQKLRLKGFYNHLPVMQEDQVDEENVKNVKAQAAATMTTSILSLVNAVKTGQMDYGAALATLINIHGLEEGVACEILVKPAKVTPPEPELTDEQKEFLKTIKIKL